MSGNFEWKLQPDLPRMNIDVFLPNQFRGLICALFCVLFLSLLVCVSAGLPDYLSFQFCFVLFGVVVFLRGGGAGRGGVGVFFLLFCLVWGLFFVCCFVWFFFVVFFLGGGGCALFARISYFVCFG